jgi:glutamate-5-semialdehyde dehydrogenase
MSASDLQEASAQMGRAARIASRQMVAASTASKTTTLLALARLLCEPTAALQAANAQDIQAAQADGLAAPMVDRLRLTDQVIATVTEGCKLIATMLNPIGGIWSLCRCHVYGFQASGANRRSPHVARWIGPGKLSRMQAQQSRDGGLSL